MFNAVIALVSHVIRTTAYFEENPALVQVEKALDMIKDMSVNHTFATRAFVFLQGLLQCMHKSLGSLHSRGDHATVADNFFLPPMTTVMPVAPLAGHEAYPALHALFGYTRDVAQDLQAQLETFEPGRLVDPAWALDDLIL